MNYEIITLPDGTKAIQMPGPTITLDTLNTQTADLESQITTVSTAIQDDQNQLFHDQGVLTDLQSQLAIVEAQITALQTTP
jgi:hypothetical protein